MNNIIKFKKPVNNNKSNKNNPFVIKVMLILLAILAILKLPELLDSRPPLYKNHDVVILPTAIKLPEDYQVTDISGNNINLSQMLGDKITVLAFWATWCGYCAKEFPFMDKIEPMLAKQNIKIIPINRGDDTAEKIARFFKSGHIKNLQAFTAGSPELHQTLGILGYPSYIAVKNGQAIAQMRPKWQDIDVTEMLNKLAAR